MIVDVTSTILTPGNNGEFCLGNGAHYDESGNLIESCCDEYDCALCCLNDACQKCKLDICVKRRV